MWKDKLDFVSLLQKSYTSQELQTLFFEKSEKDGRFSSTFASRKKCSSNCPRCTNKGCQHFFSYFFLMTYPQARYLQSLKFNFLLKFCVKIPILLTLFQSAQHLYEKREGSAEPDPYIWLMDPDLDPGYPTLIKIITWSMDHAGRRMKWRSLKLRWAGNTSAGTSRRASSPQRDQPPMP